MKVPAQPNQPPVLIPVLDFAKLPNQAQVPVQQKDLLNIQDNSLATETEEEDEQSEVIKQKKGNNMSFAFDSRGESSSITI